MAKPTLLDQACALMDQEQGRLAFYQRLAASQLFVMLDQEPEEDRIRPTLFPVDGQSFVLAFDTEERLARFAGGQVAYAALSGRVIVGLLAAQGLGLGLNLGGAPSETLLSPEAVTWLAETMGEGPDEVETKMSELLPPNGLPETLLTSLDARLATAAGLAENAYLAGVVYDSGARGHLLGIVDAVPGAEPALARAVSEVLQFSGLEAAALDVAFFAGTDPVSARLAKVGLRFDLPKPDPVQTIEITPPGSDPDNPPKLR